MFIYFIYIHIFAYMYLVSKKIYIYIYIYCVCAYSFRYPLEYIYPSEIYLIEINFGLSLSGLLFEYSISLGRVYILTDWNLRKNW
jgi:hypothetical protein